MSWEIQTEKGKISNPDYSIFFRIYLWSQSAPSWFYSIDKMAIFINAFQLFLLASSNVL